MAACAAIFDDTDVLGEIAGGFVVLRRDFIEAIPEAARNFVEQSRPRRRLVAREPGRSPQGARQASSTKRGENAELAQILDRLRPA